LLGPHQLFWGVPWQVILKRKRKTYKYIYIYLGASVINMLNTKWVQYSLYTITIWLTDVQLVKMFSYKTTNNSSILYYRARIRWTYGTVGGRASSHAASLIIPLIRLWSV
jgi:hypothetical protein